MNQFYSPFVTVHLDHSITVSDIIDNHRVSQRYIGYTVPQAISQFKHEFILKDNSVYPISI